MAVEHDPVRLRGVGDGGEHIFDAGDGGEQLARLGVGETGGDYIIDQGKEALPITADIENDDGLGMLAQLLPGDDLQALVEGAEAAGQNDEGIGQAEHGIFAGVHGADFEQFRDAVVADLELVEKFGDDAGHSAAAGQHRVGDDAHQSDAAAAEDQPDAARRHGRAQLPRRQRIGGIGPLAGAAEYGDGVQLFHGPG